jgi:hypothetical protein
LPVLSYPSQVLLDRVGLLPVSNGGFPSGYDPYLESDLDSEWPLFLIDIVADNPRAVIIRRPFISLFPLVRAIADVISGHFPDCPPSFTVVNQE